jgi:hypothetical protein
VAAGTQIIGSAGKFRDGFPVRRCPRGAIGSGLAGRRIDTGTLRQPIISLDVKRSVKINMIKINLSAAAEDGTRRG